MVVYFIKGISILLFRMLAESKYIEPQMIKSIPLHIQGQVLCLETFHATSFNDFHVLVTTERCGLYDVH